MAFFNFMYGVFHRTMSPLMPNTPPWKQFWTVPFVSNLIFTILRAAQYNVLNIFSGLCKRCNGASGKIKQPVEVILPDLLASENNIREQWAYAIPQRKLKGGLAVAILTFFTEIRYKYLLAQSESIIYISSSTPNIR